jgi:hypothetical protein
MKIFQVAVLVLLILLLLKRPGVNLPPRQYTDFDGPYPGSPFYTNHYRGEDYQRNMERGFFAPSKR